MRNPATMRGWRWRTDIEKNELGGWEGRGGERKGFDKADEEVEWGDDERGVRRGVEGGVGKGVGRGVRRGVEGGVVWGVDWGVRGGVRGSNEWTDEGISDWSEDEV